MLFKYVLAMINLKLKGDNTFVFDNQKNEVIQNNNRFPFIEFAFLLIVLIFTIYSIFK